MQVACLFLFFTMEHEKNFSAVNKALWNEKTVHHLGSDFYDMPSFLAGKSSLKDVELGLLGDVKGKKILHLQCHFGQDTLSLARMGADVTGVDLSDKAIEKAGELAQQLSLNAKFVCCNIYDLPQHLEEQFDIVFTSYGTIGWLPDMKAWAEIVARYMRPGGAFVFVEFHPTLWMFDNEFTYAQYCYFKRDAIVEMEKGTYAERGADIELQSISWNHGLSEVMQSLIDSGLTLEQFGEYDHSPYNCFANTVEVVQGKYMIRGMEGKLPMMYSLKMVKK
jgi:2-polyprenyl-3-methyl-5-hydroxy-6-metoxy-1,4-benzoquinol methylase